MPFCAARKKKTGRKEESWHVKAVDEGISKEDRFGPPRHVIPKVPVHSTLGDMSINHKYDRDSLDSIYTSDASET
jgi:hypothetical protein